MELHASYYKFKTQKPQSLETKLKPKMEKKKKL